MSVRIWSDAPKNIAYIENVCEAYTGALVASISNGLVSIYHTGLNIYEIVNTPYTQILDVSGNGFASAQAVLTYLQSLFVVQQNAALTFTFSTPVISWTINHNLGYFPAVKIYSMGGAEIEGDVLNTSNNQVVVGFSNPVAGFARLF